MEATVINLRAQMEELQAQVKSLSKECRNLTLELNELKGGKSTTTAKTFSGGNNGSDQEQTTTTAQDGSKKYPIIGIRTATQELECELLKFEFERLRKRRRIPLEGKSLGGKSVQKISKRVPINFCSYKTNVTLLISNLLETSLTNLKYYLSQGSAYGEPHQDVGSYTQEVICFRAYIYPAGLCSFQIGSTSLRIVIQFDVETHEEGSSNNLGLIFVPNDTFVEADLFDRMAADRFTPGARKKFYANGSAQIERTLRLNDLVARARMTQGPRSVIEFEILRAAPSVPKKNYFPMKPLVDGLSWAELQDQGGKTANKKRACVIEITNLLNVPLDTFKRFIPTFRECVLPPPEVAPFTREGFLVSCEETCAAEGMFCYGIGSTDLLLVVGFRCHKEGNSFGITFMPDNVPMKQETWNYLMDPGQIETLPSLKFASSQGSEVTVETRNIKAIASISKEDRAQLKITLSASYTDSFTYLL